MSITTKQTKQIQKLINKLQRKIPKHEKDNYNHVSRSQPIYDELLKRNAAKFQADDSSCIDATRRGQHANKLSDELL